MRHPWLDIPITDYEAHAGLPSVGQGQLLATTLGRVVSTFQPRTLAVFGAAGGNGLELVDPAIVRRVVALDFNPEYLAVCSNRHSASFVHFEPVLHDLSSGPPAIEPVECVFAGLVLEYVDSEPFFGYLPSLLTTGGVFSALLQLPSPHLPKVSDSPFHSLGKLQSFFSFVSPKWMRDTLIVQGFSRIQEERIYEVGGRSFHYAAYSKMSRSIGERKL